jgi:hypothetical protein
MGNVFGEIKVAADGGCLDVEGALDRRRGRRPAAPGQGGRRDHRRVAPGTPVLACALGGADGRTLHACAAPDFFEAPRMAADEATLIAIRVAVPSA